MQTILRKIKQKIYRLYTLVFFKVLLADKHVSCPKKWCGNDYGGYYVNPEFVKKDSVVYSFGIGEDVSFDKDIILNYNCTVFGFDPTPKSIDWVKAQNLKNFSFLPFGLGDSNKIIDFYLPKIEKHISGSTLSDNSLIESSNAIKVEVKDLASIAKELKHNKLAIFKMDIEGYEYQVIKSILDSGLEIEQILMEIHFDLVKNGFRKTRECFDLLKKHGYFVFGISSSCKEVSLIKKSLLA